jgi:hypothetical protein
MSIRNGRRTSGNFELILPHFYRRLARPFVHRHFPGMPDRSTITFTTTSAGGYEVHVDGHIAGHVGKAGRIWTARAGGFDLGEFPTRREAAEAVADIDRT